ncbi:unnamed protein product, partial [Angiostrongylus costaricensis]|uniref:LRRCT domain-containing protein n=1 Tax=Angiostrongylus costaricensis TaxID=334426 RepID=A0A0R3Q0M6_ANGCS
DILHCLSGRCDCTVWASECSYLDLLISGASVCFANAFPSLCSFDRNCCSSLFKIFFYRLSALLSRSAHEFVVTCKCSLFRINSVDFRDHFYGLTELHQLFLDNNKIINLEDGVFEHLPNLRKLVLDGNKIRLRAEIFDGLNALEELSLDYCGIDNLNVNAFESLPNLKKLSLRGNPFSEVPRALNALDKLEDLDISGTNIAEFHAQSLKQLYMGDMPFLYAIQDCAFCGLERLELVHMNNCSRLHEIHPNAFGWSDRRDGKVGNLKHLYVENCNIRTINENLLPWDTLEELGIGGNPINCSCETAFLLEDEYFSYEYTNTLPKCASPPELKGRLLTRVAQSDACATKLTIFMVMLLLVFGTIGIYLCVITKRCERLIRNVQNPKVSYSNLANKDDQQGLEQDFQPRPQEV